MQKSFPVLLNLSQFCFVPLSYHRARINTNHLIYNLIICQKYNLEYKYQHWMNINTNKLNQLIQLNQVKSSDQLKLAPYCQKTTCMETRGTLVVQHCQMKLED